MDFTRWFGVRCVCASGAPVVGEVVLPRASQAEMACRSYVKPSAARTGSRISSIEMGHERFSGWLSVAAGCIASTILAASLAGTPTSVRSPAA